MHSPTHFYKFFWLSFCFSGSPAHSFQLSFCSYHITLVFFGRHSRHTVLIWPHPSIYWWQVSYKVIKSREKPWNLFNQLHKAYITPYHDTSYYCPLGQTHRHTHSYQRPNQINFKKPGMCGLRSHAPGLKI